MKKPELLAPAGSMEKMKIAFAYGADAVYVGLPSCSLRAGKQNQMDEEKLVEAVQYAHNLNKKIYLAFNIYAHDRDLNKLPGIIELIKCVKPDALIMADPGLISYIKKEISEIEIHLSTQANATNYLAARFWKDQGLTRMVTARECSLEEIKNMKEKVPEMELEIFVHGAMCMSYSGRCLLSNYFTGRGANQGLCVQPCRFEYNVYLEELKRPGDLIKVTEDDHGTYFMNSKDMCMIKNLPDLIKTGVESFKIEGRLKSEYYVAMVVHNYRLAIDEYFEDTKNYDGQKYFAQLELTRHRGFTTGFYYGQDQYITEYSSSKSKEYATFMGISVNEGFFEVRNQIKLGDQVEIIIPGEKEIKCFKIEKMIDREGNQLEVVHGGEKTEICFGDEFAVPVYSVVRRRG